MKVDGPGFMAGSSFIGYHGDMDVNMGRSLHGKIFTSGREESWKATTKLQRLTGAHLGEALPSSFPIPSADPAPVLLINHPEVGADSTGDHGTIAKSSVVLVVPAALQSNSSN